MNRGRAKVFYSGRSQAVRLPKEFRLPGDEVLVQWEGRSLVLTPVPKTVGEVIRELARHPGPDASFIDAVRDMRNEDRARPKRDVKW